MSELAAPYDVSLQAVSKHVAVLEEAGLVSRSRDAQRRPVHLRAEVFDLMTKWIERYRRQAAESYQRLDALLDRLRDRGQDVSEPRPGATKEQDDQQQRQHQHQQRPDAVIEADPDLPVVRISREFDARPTP